MDYDTGVFAWSLTTTGPLLLQTSHQRIRPFQWYKASGTTVLTKLSTYHLFHRVEIRKNIESLEQFAAPGRVWNLAGLTAEWAYELQVKYEEQVQQYQGPHLKRNLQRWSQAAQINLIEPMSTASLQYIRSFKRPILYVILNQADVTKAAYAELRAIRDVAAQFTGQVFFMWGVVDVHSSIVEYLKCPHNGAIAILNVLHPKRTCFPSDRKKISSRKKCRQSCLAKTIEGDEVNLADTLDTIRTLPLVTIYPVKVSFWKGLDPIAGKALH